MVVCSVGPDILDHFEPLKPLDPVLESHLCVDVGKAEFGVDHCCFFFS